MTIVGQTVIQILVFVVCPPPTTVIGYFNLLHSNRLLGLLDLDLLSSVDFSLAGVLFLALYAALKRVSQSFAAVALVVCLVGIAFYFAIVVWPRGPVTPLGTRYGFPWG